MAEPDDIRAADVQNVRRYLTFRADGRLYAVPAEDVREIVLPPSLAKVPLSPKALLGLGNLRGSVLPVASLALLLNPSADAMTIPAQRVIVLEGRLPFGILVEAVASLVSVDVGQISVEEARLSADDAEELLGAFPIDGSDDVARILDIRSLVARSLGAVARSAQPAGGLHVRAQRAQVAEVAEALETFITFVVAGQEFGLPLASVREVLPSAEITTAMPRAETVVLGLTGLRNSLLPLLSLRVLLGFAPAQGASMTLVAVVGGALVGLAVDSVRDIVRVSDADLEAVPGAIASRTQGEAAIQSVLKIDNGNRLIAILSPEKLFREDVMNRIKSTGAGAQPTAAASSANGVERIFLVFTLGGQEFGLAISSVEEVARLSEDVTPLPKSPDFLKGVVNLRGVVLPIIDQRRRFDLPANDEDEGRRLVVVRIGASVAGFIVDGVSEVLRVPASAIEPPPDVVVSHRVLEGLINLEESKRMILLLDPSQLLNRTEQGLLHALGRVQEEQSAVDQGSDR